MSFEQPNFNKENPEQKLRPPHEILQDLRKLRGDYFKRESDEDKIVIEQNQRKLIQQLEAQTQKIIDDINNTSIPESDRDKLMGQYGAIMDQMAINIPWSEMSMGRERDMQSEALQRLRTYLEKHPQAKEVAHSIFMLFHHGAEIDKTLTAEAYQQMLQRQLPAKEFARQYVEAENKGKKFLEKYIALTLGKEQFSLDNDYQKLIDIEQMSDEQFSCILDVANWYRRIAYYQKIAGLDGEQKENTQRAIELHKKLIEKDPTLGQFLDAIYQEQGIEKPNQ
jgi:hypothetical protein